MSADTICTVEPATRERVFATVEEAIEDIRQGKFVVVVDAADRENEGDLTIAAQFATPEAINFMATHGRGLICLPLTPERCDELGLEQVTNRNETRYGTAFTVPIEAREGVSTGISAHDRSRTIQVAIDPSRGADDLVSPGHVFPLRARAGGVLERAGQTEAAVDLARLAGLNPAGVVCEVMADDGTMARVPDLIPYCERHGIKLVTVEDLIEHRRRHERLVERTTNVRLPTLYGDFSAVAFREVLTGKTHLALVRGEVDGRQDVLVRVHSECLTGDVFHSLRCDCGEQLELALHRIASEERGVLLYMAQEGRGIGLLNKLKAYELQEEGLDTVEANLRLGFPADARDYGIGNQILAELGLSTIRLLTNNPKKIVGIEGFGLTVVDQVPIETEPNAENRRYLDTKREKLGHRLHHQGLRYGPEGEASEPFEEQRQFGEPDEQAAESALPFADPVPEPEPDGWPEDVVVPVPDAEPLAAEPAAWAEHAPGELDVPSGYGLVEGQAEGAVRRSVGIVVARFNGEITQRLLDSAFAELDSLGVLRANVTVMAVPGAFELPLAAMALAKTRRYACIVALGCVIRGETPHFDYVAGEAASGLQLAALETGVPVSFGILTTETREQAEARVDRGGEAVRTGLEMAHLFSQLRALASAS